MRARWCWVFIALLTSTAQADPDRLDAIRQRGALTCGIWPHVRGFAAVENGTYKGFEIDLCRAIAAAIFGDARQVRFVALAHVEQFTAGNDIDLAIRRLTRTPKREADAHVKFGPVVFYDGQSFLVPHASGIENARQLSGKRICVLSAERHPQTVFDYFESKGGAELVLVASDQEAERDLNAHRCDAYSADYSWLAAARASFRDGLEQYDLLDERISKEPLAPLTREHDAALARVVEWTIDVLITAEELGVTAANVAAPKDAEVKRFLDNNAHAQAVIQAVGNYGEVFDRNLGEHSDIRMRRGLNRLWSEGGLLYAPPLDR